MCIHQHSYLQYCNIATKALRNVLKGDVKIQALKREEQYVRMAKWQAGKQQEFKTMLEYVPPTEKTAH